MQPIPARPGQRSVRLTLLIITALLISSVIFQPADVTAQTTPPAPTNGFLTGPNNGDPLDIALNYLRQNAQAYGLRSADIQDLIVQSRYQSAHNGVTHINLRQRLNGIEVFNGDIAVNIAADGSIINLVSHFEGNLAQRVNRTRPAIGSPEALARAGFDLNLAPRSAINNPSSIITPTSQGARGNDQSISYLAPTLSADPIPMKLIYQPLEDRTIRLAWNMVLRLPDGSNWLDLRVDAENGALLSQVEWMSHSNSAGQHEASAHTGTHGRAGVSQSGVSASYAVYPLEVKDPDHGSRVVVTDPHDLAASPYGWHDTNGVAGAEYTITRGNNAFAYADRFAPDGYNSGAGDTTFDGGSSLTFTPPLDLSQAPNSYTDASVVQLFYTSNRIHDVLYRFGFDEASGNFQTTNYSGSGLGNDALNAEAQDYYTFANANFSTPPDGQTPRMQVALGSVRATFQTISPTTGDFTTTGADFNPTTWDVTGELVAAYHLSAPSNCGTLTPNSSLVGKIALVDRDGCSFVDTAKQVKTAGGIGLVIIQRADVGSPTQLGGSAAPNEIVPSQMISNADGIALRNSLSSTTVSVKLQGQRVDSVFDTSVVIHEYGHGLTNRLTGGPANSNCLSTYQSRGMGEGWSDFVALVIQAKASDTATTQQTVGNWLLGNDPNGTGIRTYPYTTNMAVNPQTFDDVKSTTGQEHNIGQIWAAMLWEVYWELQAKEGFDSDLINGSGGNRLALQLVIDALKLQGCNPSFIEARDSILLADQVNNAGANSCAIWNGFAKRGLGYKAQTSGANSYTNLSEDFSLPPSCSIEIEPVAQVVCIATTQSALFNLTLKRQDLGLSTLSASGLPSGSTASFQPSQINPNQSSQLTIANLGGAPVGTYPIMVTATSGAQSTRAELQLELFATDPSAATLLYPSNGSQQGYRYQTFYWDTNPTATSYRIEIASDAAFSQIIETGTVSTTFYENQQELNLGSTYYWRLFSINPCGEEPSSPFSFEVVEHPNMLVVDDDANWPDVYTIYGTALMQASIGYELWDTEDDGIDEPTYQWLRNFSSVLWFGGPNEYGVVTDAGEIELIKYLDQGGCLAMSMQDHAFFQGDSDFTQNYLGIASSEDNAGQTQVSGQGPFTSISNATLNFSPGGYANYADELTLKPDTKTAFMGNNGIVGAYKETATYRTLFAAFPFETLPSASLPPLFQQIAAWCGEQTDLAISGATVPSSPLLPGQSFEYVLSYKNQSSSLAQTPSITFTLPSGLVDIQVTASQAITPTADPLVWKLSDLAGNATASITLTGKIDPNTNLASSLSLQSLIMPSNRETDLSNNQRSDTLQVVVPKVSFAQSSVNLQEGDSPLTIVLTLDRANPYSAITLPLQVAGTAQQGSDYTLSSTSVSFPAGSTSAQITLTALNDNQQEANETIVLSFGALNGASAGSVASMTITLSDKNSTPSATPTGSPSVTPTPKPSTTPQPSSFDVYLPVVVH
jgi:extracellular elastinolytic metalloproteinase